MHVRAILAAAGVLGLTVALQALAEDRGDKKIAGVYTIVRGENEGKQVAQKDVEGSRVVITADSIVSTDAAGKRTYVASYTLDRSKEPHRIHMTVAEGDFQGKKAEGIVAWEGDRLKLCYALPDGKVPTSFSTQEGGKQLCFILEPVKASPKKEQGRK